VEETEDCQVISSSDHTPLELGLYQIDSTVQPNTCKIRPTRTNASYLV